MVLLNFIPFNSKSIYACEIRYPYVKCKNTNFHHKDVVMIHLLKNDSSRNTYVCLHMKNYIFLTKIIINTTTTITNT